MSECKVILAQIEKMKSNWDTNTRHPAGKKARHEKKSPKDDVNVICAKAVKKASKDLRKELRKPKICWDNADTDSNTSTHEMDVNRFAQMNISEDEDSCFV